MLATNYGSADYLFFVLNLCIVTGYMAAAITLVFARKLLPKMTAIFSPLTRYSAAAFFCAASATRTELAWHAVIQEPYLNLTNAAGVPLHVNAAHAAQALLIWAFILLAGRDLVTFTVKKNGSE